MVTTAPLPVDTHAPTSVVTCRLCRATELEEPVATTVDAVVLPSHGSLVEGWLLLVPNRHVLALADLTEAERRTFGYNIERTVRTVNRVYGTSVAFEHGPAAPSSAAGCGVDHAHLHVVPTSVDLMAGASQMLGDGAEINWTSATHPWDGEQTHRMGLDYLYLRDQQSRGWIGAIAEAPSQLFRRVIARALGEITWDWKADWREETSARTVRRLRSQGL
jgi:diadenosine tetraphosphate (Ap4A) HIT family hydrolase